MDVGPDDDKRAIAEALREHDGPELRKAVARALGVTVSQVSRWYLGRDRMTPRQVFTAERALGLPPGELSTAAGFAPIGAPVGVVAAIAADGLLSDRDRRVLRALYRELRRVPAEASSAAPTRRPVAAKRRRQA